MAANRGNFLAEWMAQTKQGVGQAQQIKQQAEQNAATAKLIREQLGKAEEKRMELGIKQQMVLPEKAATGAVELLKESREKAGTTAEGLEITPTLMAQLDNKTGMFTGKWANEKLQVAQIAKVLGYPVDESKIVATQSFAALIGQRVAAGVKAFGSGTSITNSDREYVRDMVGGNIALDEGSIRRILQITDQISRGKILKHNSEVDALIKAQPSARAYLEPFKVEVPPPLVAPAVQWRLHNYLYQTPKGELRWNGKDNSWYPANARLE